MPKLTPEQQEAIYPTRWKSNQPQNNSHIHQVSGHEPAPDMGQRVVARYLDEGGDGEIKEASIPSCYYEKFIKPCGTVATIVLKCTSHMTNVEAKKFEDNSPYMMINRSDQYAAGCIHYETGESRKGAWSGDWAKDREPLIGKLQKAQTAKMQRAEDKRNAELQGKTTETIELLKVFMKTATEADQKRAAKANGGE